jgi:hypothetical protein
MNRTDLNCINLSIYQEDKLMQFGRRDEKAGVRWTSS